jgi:hypothetical protein
LLACPLFGPYDLIAEIELKENVVIDIKAYPRK